MRNLVMWHPACGHAWVDEVSTLGWETLHRAGHHTRIGRRTRMAHVHAQRFWLCPLCADSSAAMDELVVSEEIGLYEENFRTLPPPRALVNLAEEHLRNSISYSDVSED